MKNKEQFITALKVLFFSWGGDTPEEIIWGCNELLEWYELEYDVKLDIHFKYDDLKGCNFDEVIAQIKN